MHAASLCLALVLLQPPALAGGPGDLTLLAVDPPANALGASTGTAITIDFDQPLQLASLDEQSIEVLGTWSGVADLRFTLLEGGTRLRLVPRQPFFPGEQVSLSLSTLVQAASGATLPTGGHASQFWTAPAPGSMALAPAGVLSTRLPNETFVRSYGLHAADLDHDGAPDFTIPNEHADDVRVMASDGCAVSGAMDTHTLAPDSTPSANVAADLDRDGRLDFVVAAWGTDELAVLGGDGQGGFAPAVSYPVGDVPRGLAALDVEGDGDTDLISAHRVSSDLGLLRNDGQGGFLPMVAFDGGGHGETSVVAADADLDGRWDLFVAHYLSDEVTVLHGDGSGGFAVADRVAVGREPWMLVAGDLDGDGHLDAASCDSDSASASVLRGDGSGGLQPHGVLSTGSFAVAIDLGDLDGDGDLDLVTSSFSSQHWRVHVNDGTAGFPTAFDLPATQAASCATLVDFDRDGRLDLVGVDELADEIHLWRQQAPALPGVQASTCQATLRVDNLAHGAGFGGQPAHALALEGSLHVGLTAAPRTPYLVLAGASLRSGAPTSSGLLNLAPGWIVLVMRTTDADGEDSKLYQVPPGLPAGLELALQAFALTPRGFQLSNPHALLLHP